MKRIVIHIDRISMNGMRAIARADLERAIRQHVLGSRDATGALAAARGVSGALATSARRGTETLHPTAERIGAAVAQAVRRNTGR